MRLLPYMDDFSGVLLDSRGGSRGRDSAEKDVCVAWVDNLSKAIALAKSQGMVGFKLSDGIATSPNRFGYYMLFEDADYTMKELFDTDSVDVIPEGVTVGRNDTALDQNRPRSGLIWLS